MQETQVRSLVGKDPTWHGAAEPDCHDCWARPSWRLCSATREAATMRSLCTSTRDSACRHADPAQPKMKKYNYFLKIWGLHLLKYNTRDLSVHGIIKREFSHGCLMTEGQKLKQYYLLLAFNIMIAFNIKALNSNSINMLHLKSANGQLSISQTYSELNKNHQLPESQLWAGGVFQRKCVRSMNANYMVPDLL